MLATFLKDVFGGLLFGDAFPCCGDTVPVTPFFGDVPELLPTFLFEERDELPEIMDGPFRVRASSSFPEIVIDLNSRRSSTEYLFGEVFFPFFEGGGGGGRTREGRGFVVEGSETPPMR